MANDRKMMPRPDRVIDGSCPNRREKLLAGINIAKLRGLEVAPLSRATVRKSEGDITYIVGSHRCRSIRSHGIVAVDCCYPSIYILEDDRPFAGFIYQDAHHPVPLTQS